MYGVKSTGELAFYRHPANPTAVGQFSVSGVQIGMGWNGLSRVIASTDGVLYGIKSNGVLMYYRHPANPTAERQFEATAVKIGSGRDQFATVLASGGY